MRHLLCRLTLALCLLPLPASAQGSAEALGTELFNEGRALMDEGRFAEAQKKLAESVRLDLQVGTLARLAECEEKLGQLTQSRAHWQQALNLARSQGDERADIVAKELERVDAAVPKLVLTPAKGMPIGLVVRVDDTEIGPGSLGTPIPLDPGPHRLRAEAPGYAAWSKTVAMSLGQTTRERLPQLVQTERAHPVAAPPRPPPAAPLAPEDDTLRIAGYAAAGAGVISLGFGVYFASVAQSKLDLSNRVGCDGNRCTQSAADVRNEARSAGNLATAFLIGGGALAAGGITLVLLAPKGERAPHATAAVGPRGVSLGGVF